MTDCTVNNNAVLMTEVYDTRDLSVPEGQSVFDFCRNESGTCPPAPHISLYLFCKHWIRSDFVKLYFSRSKICGKDTKPL